MAVEEQERRAFAAAANPHRHFAEVDPIELEAGEELAGHPGILCDKIAAA
jgi:hypothetical protein